MNYLNINNDLGTLTDQFLKKLSKVQEDRQDFQDLIEDEFEWVIRERKFMVALTQETRKLMNLEPVDENLILRAEREACGHVDYSNKFALYCAEIALTGKLGPIF